MSLFCAAVGPSVSHSLLLGRCVDFISQNAGWESLGAEVYTSSKLPRLRNTVLSITENQALEAVFICIFFLNH